MKAIIVTGQYGSGKTETIKGMIRGALSANLRVGAFVAESANIALDEERYNIGDRAVGLSFASVCCPTKADMDQAMNTALRDRRYDLLFLEPPGNMHPSLMAQLAVEKNLNLEHVIMLVSERDFDTDRHRTTFHSGLEIANLIGITHGIGREPRSDMLDVIRNGNPNATIVSFPSSGLEYSVVSSHPKWSLERMGDPIIFDFQTVHSEHYDQKLVVLNPELSYEQICSTLRVIAETGAVERAKGKLPRENKKVDMKRTFLEISTPEFRISPNSMGYLIFFGKNLPMQIINQIAVPSEQNSRETLVDAPVASKFAIFSRLYEASARKTKEVFVNGKVTHAYTPLDIAEKVATEIFKDTGDTSALKVILPVSHATKIYALRQLAKAPAENANAFTGILIASMLINTSMPSSATLDYTKLSDQHQLAEIRQFAVPELFRHLSRVKASEFREFPKYASATGAGAYILSAAKEAWNGIKPEERGKLSTLRKAAVDNMKTAHLEVGFVPLAESWDGWVG